MTFSLAELQTVDPRVLHFGNGGLNLGGALPAEAACGLQQEWVASATLAPAVAEGTRASFERLKLLHAYGILCYDLYTVAADGCLLVTEQALRDRFLAFYYDRPVPFWSKTGPHPIQTQSYPDIINHLREAKNVHLVADDSGGKIPFRDGMLADLLRWSRAHQLLRGQRARHIETLIKDHRNLVAHPSQHHLSMPVDSARAIHQLAEFINQLWGHPTPGGRLYPAPVERAILAIGLSPMQDTVVGPIPVERLDAEQDQDYTWIVVRGAVAALDMVSFNPRYATAVATEFLFGPASPSSVLDWFKREQPQQDTVDRIDQIFVVRRDREELWRAQRAEVVSTLPPDEQTGDWWAVWADHPDDAYAHVLNAVTGQERCQAEGLLPEGPRCGCAAVTLVHGPWLRVERQLQDLGALRLPPSAPPDIDFGFDVPHSWPIPQ